jgi:hypothetical protein
MRIIEGLATAAPLASTERWLPRSSLRACGLRAPLIVQLITGTLRSCDPFGIPSTSDWMAAASIEQADALLSGRVTHEMMAAGWRSSVQRYEARR